MILKMSNQKKKQLKYFKMMKKNSILYFLAIINKHFFLFIKYGKELNLNKKQNMMTS